MSHTIPLARLQGWFGFEPTPAPHLEPETPETADLAERTPTPCLAPGTRRRVTMTGTVTTAASPDGWFGFLPDGGDLVLGLPLPAAEVEPLDQGDYQLGDIVALAGALYRYEPRSGGWDTSPWVSLVDGERRDFTAAEYPQLLQIASAGHLLTHAPTGTYQ